MILIIDNYDSFTYNLVQYIGELNGDPVVFKNDKITCGKINKLNPDKIIISPGPGRPENAGVSNDVIKTFAGSIPILGVCLGHQCIGQVFGGEIIRSEHIMHGKTSQIFHNKKTIFENVPNPFEATRYHSLLVKRETLPSSLEIIAQTKIGEIMGLKHKKMPVFGVQFHPESILTKEGKLILSNFLNLN